MLARNDFRDTVGVCKKLKLHSVMCYDAGAGVSEPGLNRRPEKIDCLRYGGGLKILWRRPSWVQVPPPAPLWGKGRGLRSPISELELLLPEKLVAFVLKLECAYHPQRAVKS